MTSKVLSHDGLSELGLLLKESGTPHEFLAAAEEIVADPTMTLDWPVDLSEPEPLIVGRRAEGSFEGANAVSVYEYVGALDRVNASDPRLWAYLALTSYRDYMSARWPLDGVKNWQNRARARWVFSSSSAGRLVRHGVARLWWVSHLTFDPHCVRPLSREEQDPFAYTRIALENEDRTLALFDRVAGGNEELRFAVLEHIAAAPHRASGTYAGELMKLVTREGGVRELRCCAPDALREIVEMLGRELDARGVE